MARLDHALYRLLLRIYPAAFRHEHAAELEAIYAHCLEVERRRRGRFVARCLALADALRAAWLFRQHTAPDRRPVVNLGSIVQDLRYAVRTVQRAPAFFAGTVLILALGIGANAAIFSLVEAVLLEPLPYRAPDQLSLVYTADPARPERKSYGTTVQVVEGLRQQAHHIDVATTMLWDGNIDAQFDLVRPDGAVRLRGALVSPNFFQVLGVDASQGRVFTEADDTGSGRPVVISHDFWTRTFAHDPAVIGRELTLVLGRGRNRAPRTVTIVGVAPRQVRFTYPDETEVWAMQSWAEVLGQPRGAIWFRVVARLRPGVARAQANASLEGLLERATPVRGRELRLEPMEEWVTGAARPPLVLLGGVSLLLLLVTCATVANALLVRLAERRGELALRASLGAARGRVVRQLLTEGLFLSGVGTVVGSGLAVATLPVFRSLVPAVVPRGDEIGVDAWMVAFAAAVATVVTVLATMVPAVQASRVDLVAGLKQSSGSVSATRSTRRWRSALVATQALLATCLLVGASLLLVSFWRLGRVDPGYDGRGVLTVEMRIIDGRFADPAEIRRLQDDILSRVRAVPGVLEAGITTAVPFRGVDFYYSLERAAGAPSVGGNGRTVDAEYFSVMRIPVKRGRLFQAGDTPTAPKVAVLSDSFARAMFGDEDPVGQRFDPDDPTTVVGIVGDLRYGGRDQEPVPAVYYARSQRPSELFCLVIRRAADADIGHAVRQAIQRADPELPAMKMATLDQLADDSVADRRFYTTTTSVFAGLALLLTATGLVVVIARSVAERRREMAIRLALGARPGALVGLVARQGLLPVLAGTLAGLGVAWFASRLVEQFLFGVAVREPAVLAASAGLTMAVAIGASLVPARTLVALTPASVLRGE